MKYSIVKKRYAPIPPYECELFEVDIPAIPYMLHALWLKQQKYFWESDLSNWKTARTLIARQGVSLLMPCAKDIVDGLDRLYRQQEVIHRGAVYTYTGEGTTEEPYIVTPAIPIVPIAAVGEEPGQSFFIAKIMRLVDNLTNGTAHDDAPDTRNLRQQLDDIKAAIEAIDTDDTDLLEQLQVIAALLA